MKEALNLALELIATLSKKSLAVLIIATPLLAFALATMYVKHRFEIENTKAMTSRLNKMDTLVTRMQSAQVMNNYEILQRIDKLQEFMTSQDDKAERRIVTEFVDQLRFVIRYQKENTRLVLDHLEIWKQSYLYGIPGVIRNPTDSTRYRIAGKKIPKKSIIK